MANFNLQDYETVESRLEKFWADHPNGRIETELVDASDTTYLFKALLWRDAADERPAATGHAQETVGSSPVNRTSAAENCETSAIGRALANLGYATKGKRPSREEMAKAQRGQGAPAVAPSDPAVIRAEIARWANDNSVPIDAVSFTFQEWSQGQLVQEADAATLVQFRDGLQSGAVTVAA